MHPRSLIYPLLLLSILHCSSDGARKIGESCTRDEQCASTRCDELVCKPSAPAERGEPCDQPLECRSENCAQDVCGPGTREDGSPCGDDAQCASGQCTNSLCGGAANDGGADLPVSDGDVPDGGLPDAGGREPRCARPGPALEVTPATAGDSVTVRPSSEPASFCVVDDQVPGAAWGDDQCAALGEAYTWRTPAESDGNSTLSGEASKEVYDPNSATKVQLIGRTYLGSSDYVSATDITEFHIDDASTNGTSAYAGACLPLDGYAGYLKCTKDAQRPTRIDSLAVDGAFAAAYDAANDRYVLVYPRGGQLFFATVDAYAKTPTAAKSFATYRQVFDSPLPRIAISSSSRLVIVWQDETGVGGVMRRFALLDAAGDAIVAPVDLLPFVCFNSDGQHGVAYDADHDRFLVAANGNKDGDTDPISLHYQLYDGALAPQGARKEVAGKGDPTWGLYGDDSLFVAYNRKNAAYLIHDAGEAITVDWRGNMLSHRDGIDTRLYTLAANSDHGTFRALCGDGAGGLATLPLGQDGVPNGPPQSWTVRGSAAWPSLLYFPLQSSGAFAGKYLAGGDEVHLFLNNDGGRCFPAMAREYVGQTGDGLLVANTRSGGYAHFFLDRDQLLHGAIYLSNGDRY